jgi:hypothetical protein
MIGWVTLVGRDEALDWVRAILGGDSTQYGRLASLLGAEYTRAEHAN